VLKIERIAKRPSPTAARSIGACVGVGNGTPSRLASRASKKEASTRRTAISRYGSNSGLKYTSEPVGADHGGGGGGARGGAGGRPGGGEGGDLHTGHPPHTELNAAQWRASHHAAQRTYPPGGGASGGRVGGAGGVEGGRCGAGARWIPSPVACSSVTMRCTRAFSSAERWKRAAVTASAALSARATAATALGSRYVRAVSASGSSTSTSRCVPSSRDARLVSAGTLRRAATARAYAPTRAPWLRVAPYAFSTGASGRACCALSASLSMHAWRSAVRLRT
jgi:hypothetical protein